VLRRRDLLPQPRAEIITQTGASFEELERRILLFGSLVGVSRDELPQWTIAGSIYIPSHSKNIRSVGLAARPTLCVESLASARIRDRRQHFEKWEEQTPECESR
jgi:hypothetical protein